MPTPQAKPQLPGKPIDGHSEPTTVNDGRTSSACVHYTLDVGLLMAFPCEPMARATASVGMNYTVVFVLVALLYGGGITCFGAAAAVARPVFDVSAGYALLAGWVLSMTGAVASGACVLLGWEFASTDYDEDPTTTFDPSSTSKTLVVVYVGCQFLILALIAHLRREILSGANASSCCSSWVGGSCFTLCLPCCAFAEAMQRTRAAQVEQASKPVQDELPAYAA